MGYSNHLVVDNIESVKTTPNYILIKPGPENNFIKIGEDMEVWIDGSYEPEKHAVTYGDIIVIPPYVDDDVIELQKDDRIFFHYLCVMNAIRDSKYIICDGQFYFIINYSSIYCATRGEEVIVTNGYALVEPIEDNLPEQTSSGFIIPKSQRQKNNCNEGIVRYCGKVQDGVCSIGDTIFYRKNSVVPLQYELFSNFGKMNYYRIKNDHIYGTRK